MDTTIETYEHAGFTVRISGEPYIDECFNPRNWGWEVSTIYAYHPHYGLGGERDVELPSTGLPEIDCPDCEDSGECERCYGHGYIEPDVDAWLRSIGAVVAEPLFLLDHSGLAMRSGRLIMVEDESVTREDTRSSGRFIGDEAGWDTSFVGFITATEAELTEAGVERTPEALEKFLDSEVSIFSSYLEGDVTLYSIENEDGDVLDSCGGFLGWDEDYIKSQANEAAEALRAEADREAERVREWAARDVITEG